MNTNRRHAVAALVAAGLLWGTTVPLSKLALQWLAPGWLTVVRFGLAAAVLLPVARRRGASGSRRGRRALQAKVLFSGAIGYGGTVIVQNAGITRTSVTHAALLIGAVPVLVAIIAAVTSPTPPSDSAKPNQATGRATVRCHTAAMIATSTGTAPMSRAAWVTLVRVMPAF